MKFYFAIDEVVPCVYRRTFPIEADSIEEAQKLAEFRFNQFEHDSEYDRNAGTTPEVYLDTEDKPIGRRELIYRAENGGQVLKSNA